MILAESHSRTPNCKLLAPATSCVQVIQPAGLGRPGRHGPSLFKLMNRTRTLAGARLLRASLLQPLTDVATLNLRCEKGARAAAC